MRKIAHIINPVKIQNPDSDLVTAQPITFETMRRARERAKGVVEVALLSAQYPEDHEIIPDYFHLTPDLTRSVQDFGTFAKPRKYPLIGDILQKGVDHTDAEYLIYTNVDIALQEDFYLKVNEFLDRGHEALIINRRRISAKYVDTDQIEEMWQEKGLSHPGFDCFVFRRDDFSKFQLAHVCVGVPFIGILTAQNLFAFGKNFKLFDQEFLTQHIGLEIFKKRAPEEYLGYNRAEFRKAIAELDPHLHTKKFPYSHLWLPFRLIKWGLHPSIPIKLALRLEWRQFLARVKK